MLRFLSLSSQKEERAGVRSKLFNINSPHLNPLPVERGEEKHGGAQWLLDVQVSPLELSPSLRGKAQSGWKWSAVKSSSENQSTAAPKELSCCVEVLWRMCGIKV